MKPEPIRSYVLSGHARFEMERRGLSEEAIRQVLERPEQRYPIRPGREVLQSRLDLGALQRRYLVRVFVDVDRSPSEVVTAYRTSKLEKYWRPEP